MRELNENCGIYGIIIDGLKIYIGSSENLKRRKRIHLWHLKRGDHPNSYLQSAFNKYGEDNFEWKVLEICKKEELLKREQHFMDYYNSTNRDCGYNLSLKSDKIILNNETREKIGKSHKGKKSSLETRERISKSKKGQRPWLGRKHKPESIEKMRLIKLGKKLSEEHKKKIGEAGKGRTVSLNTRKKISIIHKGKKLSQEAKDHLREVNTGKHHTAETKEKMSQSKLGTKMSLEARQKLSKAKTGKKMSKEAIEKAVKTRKERGHNFCTEETKNKLRLTNKGRILAKTKSKKVQEYIKLTTEWIKLRKDGLTYHAIGEMYNVCHTSVMYHIKQQIKKEMD